MLLNILPISKKKSAGLKNHIPEIRFLILFLSLIVLQSNSFSQESKSIDYKADSIKSGDQYGSEITRFIGNVKISHEDVIMYCDSAHVNKIGNSFVGYGNVYLNQNDTIEAYGDWISYDGDTKIAQLRQNARLIHEKMELTTNYLNHDMINNVSYYFNGGEIVDSANFLSSSTGRYFADEKLFFFRNDVVLRNKENLMESDTLKYNRNSKITYFYGPTEIFSDSNYIYCENGWYNTDSDIAQFRQNAFIRSGVQTLEGDSIYYDRKSGYGEAFENVAITDIVENMILEGNYAFFNETDKKSFLTGNALFLQVSDGDTLFLHADTLISLYDSSFIYRNLMAFHHVKFYRKDIQGKCDSLLYSFTDSLIQLMKEPVLWHNNDQLSSELITIYTKNKDIDYIELNELAFIISLADSTRFNQIKGKKIIGHVRNRELYKIDVNGNGQSIYFPVDEGELIGTNKAESSNIEIIMADGQISIIKLLADPDSNIYPLDHLKPDELKLEGWTWQNKSRPGSRKDIFIWK